MAMVRKPPTPSDRMAAARAAKAAKAAARAKPAGHVLEEEIDTEAEAEHFAEEDSEIDGGFDAEYEEAPEPAPPRGRAPAQNAAAKRAHAKKTGRAPPPPMRVGRHPAERERMQRTARPTVLRDDYGRIAAYGRDGKTLLSRKVTDTGDKFYIPKEDVPDGWTYQWIAAEVIGKEENNSHYMQNGWSPVPAKRHDGKYMRPGASGNIVVDGMILVERPEVLTEDARTEELQNARNQLRTQNDQFKPKLPGARSQPGTGLRAKRSIEGLPSDIGRPQYEIDTEPGLV